MSAITYGRDWSKVKTDLLGCDLVAYYHQLEMYLDDEFDKYRKQMQLENEDRIDLAISTLNGQIDRQIAARESAIYSLREKGKLKMIRLFEAQIRNLETTRENRTSEFNQRRKINNEPSDVIMGVVYVE